MAIPRRSRKVVSQQSISWSPDTLIRDMEQLRIYYNDLDKVHEYQLKSRYEELNKRSTERAARDAEQLAASQARREAIQKEADAVLSAWVREQEEKAERERQIEAARVAAERKAKAEAEARARREREETEARERAQREETARVEEEARQKAAAAAKRAAEEKKAREEAEALKRQQEEEDAAKAEAAQKVEAEALQKQQQQQQEQAQQHQPQATTTTPHPPTTDQAAAEALHARYLAIHARLKTFRRSFWASAKADPALKNKVGDMRRALRTSVGQLIEGKGVNTQPTQRVKAVFQQAFSLPSPPIDIRDYLATIPADPASTPASAWQVPSLFIWTLSIFAKAIIAQFTTESGVSTHTAEPTGILLVQILSLEEFQFVPPPGAGPAVPMIDILLAKYHSACPLLWGIHGPESTAAGKRRLGWRIEERNGARGFVPDQQHYDRMNGLGAGYAAIALRNFSKTKLRNPYPPVHFWESLAGIVNVAPEQVTTTHLVVLRAMLENCTERFLLFYGNVGVAALRLSLVEFPGRLPGKVRDGAACKAVGLLVDGLRGERRFNVV